MIKITFMMVYRIPKWLWAPIDMQYDIHISIEIM